MNVNWAGLIDLGIALFHGISEGISAAKKKHAEVVDATAPGWKSGIAANDEEMKRRERGEPPGPRPPD